MKNKSQSRAPFLLALIFPIILMWTVIPAYGKGPVIIRFVVPTPTGDMLTVKDQELAENFNSRANGEYMIQVFPGESIVRVPEYLDAVRVGAIEMADTAWGIYSGHDKRLGATEMPFLFNNLNACIDAVDELLPLYDNLLQKKFNQKALSLFAIGGMELVSTKPVKTVKDWKGLMTGAINPQISALTQILGGAPVVVTWTDLYTSLQKKIIDAGLCNTHQILTFSLTDVCSNVTLFYGASGWQGYSVNLNVWKKMPQHIREILLDETDKAAKKMHREFLRLYDEDIQHLRNKGIKVHVISSEERKIWAGRFRPYIKREISFMGDFGEKIMRIADEVNGRNNY